MWNSLISVIILIFFTDVVVCKPDYIFDREVDGWLSLHPVPDTWQNAFLNCRNQGAVLASPTTPQLAKALQRIIKNAGLDNSIFLGARALNQGYYVSVEGVPARDLSITWGTYGDGQEPGRVLSMSPDGKTYTSSLTSWFPYICYKKRDNTTVHNRCGTFDDDYNFYRATGSCYKYHKKPTTWWVANKICLDEGSHLVILNDQKEANLIAEMMSGESHAYIGLRDWNGDNTWLTINGEEIEDVYHTWAPGNPKGKQGCATLWVGKGLYDTCLEPHRFICEKDPTTSRFEKVCFAEDCVAPSDVPSGNIPTAGNIPNVATAGKIPKLPASISPMLLETTVDIKMIPPEYPPIH